MCFTNCKFICFGVICNVLHKLNTFANRIQSSQKPAPKRYIFAVSDIQSQSCKAGTILKLNCV